MYSVTGLFRVVGFGAALSRARCMGSRVPTMIWKHIFFEATLFAWVLLVCTSESANVNFRAHSPLEQIQIIAFPFEREIISLQMHALSQTSLLHFLRC